MPQADSTLVAPLLAGVGLMQVATRAKPNAFHFRRQVMILQRAGGGPAERQFKASCFTMTVNDFNFPQLAFQAQCKMILFPIAIQEWSRATGIAKAFSIGKAESEAVSALMTSIAHPIVTILEDAVKQRGMQRFLNHEVLSKGIFESSWTSGTGQTEAWKDELRNRGDNVLVFRFN